MRILLYLSVLSIRSRDLAMTRPACLLDRQFPEILLFGQAKKFYKEFSIFTFRG